MPRMISAILIAAVLAFVSPTAQAQELVRFASLDDNGPGQPATTIDGYLFRPSGEGAHPAIVGLHGCSGMMVPNGTQMTGLYRAWGSQLSSQGYVVLLVDSFSPRHHGETCSISGFDLGLYRKRPKDAYAALRYLQAQPFVRADRIGVIGWSQGGGIVLSSIADRNPDRPASLPQGDFIAAVAFYPGACNETRQPAWTSKVPLLVLSGDADVWTPLAPCKTFVDGAVGRGAKIEMQIYPGAVHAFDAPNRQRTELPAYITRTGVVPIVGTDPAARQDSLARVPAFFAHYLSN